MLRRPKSVMRERTRPLPRQQRRYGWVPDLPDARDHPYRAARPVTAPLPTRVDLRASCPPVYDQGELGSCTANAIAAALEFDQMKAGATDVFVPSRLFIYYNERVIEGTVDEDAGAMIRDGMKSVARQGAPHEPLWPYAIAKFRTKPSAPSYRDAAKHPVVQYERLTPRLADLKSCLASGFPFVFGFSVYDSFESQTVARTGRVPMPRRTERLLGGHAVLAVGYKDSIERFIVRNSWGVEWGSNGYFTMPYAYLLDSNLSDDFWTVTATR